MAILVNLNTPMIDDRGESQSQVYMTIEKKEDADERSVTFQMDMYRSEADYNAGRSQIWLPWDGQENGVGIPQAFRTFSDQYNNASQYANVDNAQLQGILAGFLQDGDGAPRWSDIERFQGIVWNGVSGNDALNTATVTLI
jgi:hypothetical protein